MNKNICASTKRNTVVLCALCETSVEPHRVLRLALLVCGFHFSIYMGAFKDLAQFGAQ